MKIGHFDKFYRGLFENLPFYGNISMEIGTLGKFPWIYGTMPRSGVTQIKIDHIFNGCGGQVAAVSLAVLRVKG
jgi:hypothetical protein